MRLGVKGMNSHSDCVLCCQLSCLAQLSDEVAGKTGVKCCKAQPVNTGIMMRAAVDNNSCCFQNEPATILGMT
jgi:hypothetical protein